MPFDQPISIGEMRWKVTLASRQESTGTTTDLNEQYTRICEIWAAIEPMGEEEMIGGEQIGTPVSHRITFRWLPYEDVTYFDTIIRYINLPNGERRAEIFRIRKIKEWNGRHRYIIADVELEQYAA